MSTRTKRSPNRWLRAAVAAVMIASVVATASPALAQPAVPERIGGVNRFGTAALLSEEFFCTGKENVVIANGLDFPDGLSGAVLFEPILLTQADTLPAETIAALDRIDNCADFGTIYVLGGTAAVSAGVFNQLATDYTPDTILRLSGPTRYHTAIAIAEEFGVGNTVILATGADFPDALASGPFAAGAGYPIILNDGGTLRPEVERFFNNHPQVTNVIILGGTAAVPSSIGTQLADQFGITSQRLAGANRFETAVEIAVFRFGTGWGRQGCVQLVNGQAFADALAAAPAMGCPTLLVNRDLPIPAPTAAWHVQNAPRTVNAIGGTAVISDDVLNAAAAAATPTAVRLVSATVANSDFNQAQWVVNNDPNLVLNAVPGSAVDGSFANRWFIVFGQGPPPGQVVMDMSVPAFPAFLVTADFNNLDYGGFVTLWNNSPAGSLVQAVTTSPGTPLGGPPPNLINPTTPGTVDSSFVFTFDKPILDPTPLQNSHFRVYHDGASKIALVDLLDADSDSFNGTDAVTATWNDTAGAVAAPGQQFRVDAGGIFTDPFNIGNPGQLLAIIGTP